MHVSYVEGPQGRLAVYRGGTTAPDALTILFVHSDAGRAQQWAAVCDRLQGRYRWLALDIRGHGASEPARDGDYSYAGRANDVMTVARITGSKRLVLVAHSAGAGIALHAAVHGPSMICGVFLLDPPGDPALIPAPQRTLLVDGLAGPEGARVLHDFQASLAGTNPTVRSAVAAANALLEQPARAGLGRALAAWQPRETLERLAVPVAVLVTATNDGPGALHRLRAGIPHAVIDGTGHWVQMERPSDVAAAIDRFATGLQQPVAPRSR